MSAELRDRLAAIYATVAYNRSAEADKTREVLLIAERLLDERDAAIRRAEDGLALRVARERIAALPTRPEPTGYSVDLRAVMDILDGVADDEDRRAALRSQESQKPPETET